MAGRGGAILHENWRQNWRAPVRDVDAPRVGSRAHSSDVSALTCSEKIWKAKSCTMGGEWALMAKPLILRYWPRLMSWPSAVCGSQRGGDDRVRVWR